MGNEREPGGSTIRPDTAGHDSVVFPDLEALQALENQSGRALSRLVVGGGCVRGFV
jgi:hypothetical protein